MSSVSCASDATSHMLLLAKAGRKSREREREALGRKSFVLAWFGLVSLNLE